MPSIDFEFEEVACTVAGRETLATGTVSIDYSADAEVLPSGRMSTTIDWAPTGVMELRLYDEETGDEREVTLAPQALLYADLISRCEDRIFEACQRDA